MYDAFLRVPHAHVFMDIDSIPAGEDFVAILHDWIDQSDIVLVLIGKDWIGMRDPKTGQRRLDNPNDFVRIEVRKALSRKIPVVPILLDGAQMPHRGELPEGISTLALRNAEFIDYRTFDSDVSRLIKKIAPETGVSR